MPRLVVAYVRVVDALGRAVGTVAMGLTFVLAAILLEASVARLAFGTSHIWSVELAQFVMSAYYLLGGALSEQDGVHVRMDLFYSRLSPRGKLLLDCLTAPVVLVYLGFLFYGGVRSSHWALVNNQVNYTAWAPPMAPVKMVMTAGIGLMLLQHLAVFFKDLARLLDREMA
jgi:TRAP-type C4-dicarboxylate transport system permease small subunit